MQSNSLQRWLFRILLLASVFMGVPAWACCNLTIYVDFDNSGTVKDGYGNDATTIASGLSATDRSAIINKIKEKYEAITGVGTVTISESKVPAQLNPGEYGVVVSGGKPPASRAGEWGNAGATQGPALVYLGQIKAYTEPGTGATLSSQADINTVVGETAAHEVGHRITKKDHNAESPASAPNTALMVRGAGITLAQRIADQRAFTAAEIKAIQQNYLKAFDPKQLTGVRDLPVYSGDPMPSPVGMAVDDPVFGAQIWYLGLAGWDAGYINSDGAFIYETAGQSSGSNVDDMGFLTDGGQLFGWDMALRDPSGVVYDFGTYGVDLFLDYINPFNNDVYLKSRLDFIIGADNFSIFLDASTGDPTTSGFIRVPEPSTLVLAVLALVLAVGTPSVAGRSARVHAADRLSSVCQLHQGLRLRRSQRYDLKRMPSTPAMPANALIKRWYPAQAKDLRRLNARRGLQEKDGS